ncbi:MAG: hypothetical protein HYR56_05890 [Acidobacteria bacterium]|nr:hypothetical protein [Acidobacteriota bacterium]MBI3424709.1 hypothetical protein [Acidobacteriota bacterium]
MLRQMTALVCSASFALALFALPGLGQNKKEVAPIALHLTITSQDLGSPCQGAADKVCVRLNWTVNNAPAAQQIAQFRIFVDATNGNPASKNKAEATASADARTVTVKLAPVGAGFKIKILARNSASQVLATAGATGNF